MQNIPWADVTTQIIQMNETVEKFSSKCKNLPKALRGWSAFIELQTTVEQFIEVCGTLKRVVWYFEEGGFAALKRVVCCFEEGGVVDRKSVV